MKIKKKLSKIKFTKDKRRPPPKFENEQYNPFKRWIGLLTT